MTTITLNGRKFTRGKRAMVNTLFERDGTASGYYLVRRGVVYIHKPNGELDGVINRANVLGKASKLKSGQTFYSYADLDTVGRWSSYMKECEEVAYAAGIARRK